MQITTESAGKYAPPTNQRQLLHKLRPPWASIALAEMLSDGTPDDNAAAAHLYHWAAAAVGDCRVGFENNLHHPNDELTADNAARVAEVMDALSV